VGQQQLSDLMDRLFHSQREERDKRIEAALAQGSTLSLPTAAFGRQEESSFTRISEVRGIGEWLREQHLLLFGAVGGAALVVVAIVAAFFLGRGQPRQPPANLTTAGGMSGGGAPAVRRSGPSPSPRDAGVARRPALDAALPATVTLEIRVMPKAASARIRFRDRTYRSSLLRAQLKRSDQELTVEVSARGFKDQSLVIVPLDNQIHTITLERRRRRRRGGSLRWKSLPD
jgi:hypothetical protein